MDEKVIKITSIDELRVYKEGEVVELPPFAKNQPFCARLKRPSVLSLAKSGKIPNELLTSANALFEKGSNSFNSSDKEMLRKLFEVMEVICESSFLEPTYQEIKDAGIELTDEQIMFVFGYAQHGVRQLTNFR